MKPSDSSSPIVLLHGGKQGSWVWDEVIAAVHLQMGEQAPQILALDVPGCGSKRQIEAGRLTLDDVVTQLASDLEAAGVSDALAVGHSQAGTVLPRLIATSGRIRRACYVACAAPLDGQTLAALLGEGLHGQSEDHIGWPLDPRTTPWPDLARAMFCNDMADPDAFLEKLGRDEWPPACWDSDTDWRYDWAEVPTSYVVALRDQTVPPAWQERFARRLGSEATLYVDGGHQLMQTRPNALAEVIVAEHRKTTESTRIGRPGGHASS